MIFSGLPNELILHVLNYTDPDDLESLSACCKQIQFLAQGRIKQHRAFRERYTTITFDNTDPEDRTVIHPFVLLESLLLEPRIAHYPSVINLRSWRTNPTGSPHYLHPDALSLQVAQRCAKRIHEEMTHCPYLRSDRDAHGLEGEIQHGNPDAAIALLLTLFLKLQTLHVAQHLNVLTSVSKMIFSIQQAQCKLPPNSKEPQALSKLTQVDISPSSETLNIDQTENLVLLSSLPLIQNIRVSNLFCPNYPGIPFEPRNFFDIAATEVSILGSAIDPRILASFLSNARSLIRFTYQHMPRGSLYVRWNPLLLSNVLQKNASNSLQHLDLTSNVQDIHTTLDTRPQICSLRSFAVLKKLRIDYVLLASEKHHDISGTQGLMDLLPASLEELVIVGKNDEATAAARFEGLAEMRQNFLSKLTRVTFENIIPRRGNTSIS